MKAKTVVITRRAFLFTPMALAFAQPSPRLREGYEHLYHLRFGDALSTFTAWQRDLPADPMGFISEGAVHLFEEFERHGVLTTEFFLDDDRLLGGIQGKADAGRTRAFESANHRGRQIADRVLKSAPADANALLSVTLAAGLRADYLSIIEKQQIASLKEIRAAEASGERLLKVAPSMADAYVALGAANYILACLPLYKRTVLWFGGLAGDKTRGMEQLARAADGDGYLGPYAKILLALASVREKRGPNAARLMRELTTEFPQSALFAREREKIERLAGISRPA